MRNKIITGLIAACLILAFGRADALTIDVLDQINIATPKADVVRLMGVPDHIGKVEPGFVAEVYNITNLPPLTGSGVIYDKDNKVAGHALIFAGKSGQQAMERLANHGFELMKEQAGTWLLSGKDDDTAAPIMVCVDEKDDLTTVIYLEKKFYEESLKKN